MQPKFAQFVVLAHKINRQHIQLIMVLVALALMVLGVSAPEDCGVPFGR